MTTVHCIGGIAHVPILAAVLAALVPSWAWCPELVLLVLTTAVVLAYFWPVVDYFAATALVLVSVTAAVLFVVAVVAIARLSVKIADSEV